MTVFTTLVALTTTTLLIAEVAEPHPIPSCDFACVVDRAGVLTDEQEKALSDWLREVGRKVQTGRGQSGPQFEAIYSGVVVLADGPDDMDDYAQRVLQHWGFGAKGVAIVIDSARGAVGLAAGEIYREALATPQAEEARRTLATAQADSIVRGLGQLFVPLKEIARREGEWPGNLAGYIGVFLYLLLIPAGIWRIWSDRRARRIASKADPDAPPYERWW